MNSDAATKTWLKKELTNALGFPEVDDIVGYISSTFQTKEEVASYLTELLGMTTTRAQTIGDRLFASSKSDNSGNAPKKQQPNQRGGRQGKNPSAAAATPLVPLPAQPNSRIKPAKPNSKKSSKLMHARIINCLQCGKIEHNAGRLCTFCGSELQYEELDDLAMDPAAQAHMEKLVEFDQTSASRTTVIDTDEQFYEAVEDNDPDERSRRPITLDLDLENKQFVMASRTTPSSRITRNQELAKDARELVDGIQRKLEQENKKARGKKKPADGVTDGASSAPASSVELEPLVYV